MKCARRHHRSSIAVAAITLACSMTPVVLMATDEGQNQDAESVSLALVKRSKLAFFPGKELTSQSKLEIPNTTRWLHPAIVAGLRRDSGMCPQRHLSPVRNDRCSLQWRPRKSLHGTHKNVEHYFYQANHRYANTLVNHLAKHVQLDLDLSPEVSLYYEFD